MRRRGVIGAVLVAGAVLLGACTNDAERSETVPTAEVPAAFSDPEASGEQLADAWFGLLSLTGRSPGQVSESPEEVEASRALVRPYLDPAFTLVRATGQRFTADTYVPLDVDAYEVSDVVVTSPRPDVRVVRYFVDQPGATAPDSGVVMGGGKAPRISVLRWDEQLGHWVMVSHANFNSPVAAICDQDPIPVTGSPPAVDDADLEQGRVLVEQWRNITTGRSSEKVRHSANQIQLADGQGWPTQDGAPIEWKPAANYEVENLAVARNGDLLVASYDALAEDLQMEGEEYRDTASPRLLTWLRNADGRWELIALANFTVPEEIPAGVDCIAAS